MKNKMIVVLLVVPLIYSACSHKPAYSDIDANRTSRTQNQNGDRQLVPPSGGSESAAAPATQSAPAATQPPKFRPPSFLDQVTGAIKDLPSYPNAARMNVQIGPMNGANMASFVFQSRDPVDKITAFYEQAIKRNRWKVVNKQGDSEGAEWTLEKGEEGAKVQVKKGSATGFVTIMLVRAEKLEEQSK